jgi:hypothetical protein
LIAPVHNSKSWADQEYGKPFGLGRRVYNGGLAYEGVLAAGEPRALGRYYMNGKAWYEGKIEHDGSWGPLGRVYATDGSVFEGGFKNGLMSGPGVFYFPDGTARPCFECRPLLYTDSRNQTISGYLLDSELYLTE